MNKKALIIIAVLLLLLGGGFMLMKSKTSNTDNLGSVSNSGSKNDSVFTSVKDALSKKMTLVCEFNDEKGTSTKSYIKNGAVRVSSSGTEVNQSGEFIMRDNKMYMWNETTKEGFVYDVPEDQTTAEVNQGDSYLNMIDTYKDSCKVGAVEDSYFTVPTDVKFQDMSKLLEDLQKQMPQTAPSY